MVKPFISLLFLLIFSAKAVPITLILADEVPMSDGKICVYENAQRSESVKVATAAPCHHTKTFETDD
ncbi:hypothetical protein [Pantoea endophytica]|uniref:hypothetical protein n=1 Tax=Pantoea endophytica TaxID=92488 RepID=UPI0024137F5F|nr:hypothetical protein [Pantoea endophytica]